MSLPGAKKRPHRVAVLVSGNGSNLQALIDACAAGDVPAKIALVVSNNPSAFALERARRAQIPQIAIEHGEFASRAAFEQALLDALGEHEIDTICLAGFMRLLSPVFVRAYAGRLLNIHPSLLPSFPGLHGPRQALEHGAKIAGCTVHLVDEALDAGPIVAQSAVPVYDDDTEATLAARILYEEHRLYPTALRWLIERRVQVDGRRVRIKENRHEPL